MKEQELAAKVVAWLSDLRWDVYQEVSLGTYSKRADIVAVQHGIMWVIETKAATSMSVIRQAHDWRGYAHLRSIAVPVGQRYRDRDFVEYVCRLIGVGILRVGTEVSEREPGRFDRKVCSVLRDRLRDEHKTFAPAGNANGSRWTPFQATCQDVVRYVTKNPGCSIKQLVSEVNTHYHTPSSARCALAKWIKAGVVKGVEARFDGRKMKLFANEPLSVVPKG